MRYLRFIFLFISASSIPAEGLSTITLEHAWTAEQINWGLMQRHHLPENHGMLFHYPSAGPVSFWAFNCCIDLSVAFIDDNKVIKKIASLYSHPEKMDPNRPVNNLRDMEKYKPDDPVIRFFQENMVSCQTPVRYVLEMNLGWFEKNNIVIGDTISWDTASHTAAFRKKAANPIKCHLEGY